MRSSRSNVSRISRKGFLTLHVQSRDSPHPQDVLIQQILEKIVLEKYGTDINSLYKQQDRVSKFDEAMKKFQSPKPFFKINFDDYQEEFLKCIQYGTNPVFGYPLIRFEDRRHTLSHLIKEIPEQLNDKWRRGMPRKKKSEEIQREEIKKLTEQILKKEQFADQLEKYYEEERADKRKEKWETSDLKNLPSPLFKVITKSHSQYVHRVIKEKHHMENSLKRVEEMLAKGKPVNLVKCQAEAEESLCSTSEYKNKKMKPKVGGRLFSKPTMRKSIYKKGGRSMGPGGVFKSHQGPTPGTKGSSNFVRQVNIFSDHHESSMVPSKQASFNIKGKSIHSPSLSESRGSKEDKHEDFMARMLILNKKNSFIEKKSSIESSPDTSPNSKYKYLTQRQLKNNQYDKSTNNSMQKHQSQPTNFDGDLPIRDLITMGKTQKTSPNLMKQSKTITATTKPQSVSMNIRKRSKGKKWDRLNSANPVAASSMLAKGRTGKRLKRNNLGGLTNSSKKGYESFNFANQKTTSIFQKNKYTSNTSTNRQIALQIAEGGPFANKKIDDSESRLNQESTNKSTEGFMMTSGVKSSLIPKVSLTKSTLKVGQRENLESEVDQPARQSPLTSQPPIKDDDTEPSHYVAKTYISRKSLKVQNNDRLCLSDLAGVIPRRKKSTSNRKSRSPPHDKSHLRLDELNSNMLNCSINDLKGAGQTAGAKKNSNLFQLRNQASTQANTFTQYSSGCISRSDLKYRLKTQKLCQRKIFRNTLRDLTKYVDPKSPVLGTETTQTRFHVGSSLSGLDYQNLLKSSVTNPLITPPLMATNRGSRKEDPVMLYANSAAPRNYQCYSQMNDSNHFGYGIDYSESGYSVNIKSNRGISEQNWVGQQEPIVASAGGLQQAASPIKENLLCQIYSSDYSQTASRNKLFQMNSNKHTDPENTTPKLISNMIRGNATVGTRGSQKMKFLGGNQIQEVSLSSVGTLQKKRGSKQLLKNQATSASSTTAGHFGSQQPLVGGSSGSKKLAFPKKQFVKPRILSGKQIFQLNPTEQPMTSPSFAHSSPHPKTQSEYIPQNDLSQPIYRTTEEDDGDLTYYSKTSGVKRVFKQRFEDIKEMPNESAMSGVPPSKKKKKRLNQNFRADNFQTESGNLANLEVGMPQRQNSHQHHPKPTPFFTSQQQLSQDQILNKQPLNDRSLLSLTQDQNDYMNGLHHTQTEVAPNKVGNYHFGFGPGDISLGTTMGGNLRSDIDILDNSRWMNNNSFQQFGYQVQSQKNPQMSPNTTSKNTLMVQASDSPFRQSGGSKGPRKKSRKKKKFVSGHNPKGNSKLQVGEVTCTQTPPNKQPPMQGFEEKK